MDKSEELQLLWAQVLTGGLHAYSNFYKILYPKLFSYLTRLQVDKEIAKDLLQDLFVRFWEQKYKLAHVRNIESYFFKAVRFKMLNQIKADQYKTLQLAHLNVGGFVTSIEEAIAEKEAFLISQKTLHLALEQLPSKQKQILLMKFFQGLGYSQIATTMGIQYQSVINHVYRATQFLKQNISIAELQGT